MIEEQAELKEVPSGDFPGDVETLPNLLQFGEEGYWQPPYDPFHSSANDEECGFVPSTDDDEWIQTGWRVRTYEGDLVYRHKDKEIVVQWLATFGYKDTGDSCHYERGLASLLPHIGA